MRKIAYPKDSLGDRIRIRKPLHVQQILWVTVLDRGQKLNTNLFLKLFGCPRDIPAKVPGYPAKKLGFPGHRRTYRTFWAPPLHVEDPHPT